MGESFQLGGDPGQIRASARSWSAFARAASGAASGIRSLDTADFVGDEAETYKQRISGDLPKHLDTASSAWGVVAAALSSYASELERHQQAMNALATRAGNQRAVVGSRRTALDGSLRSDRSHALSVVQTRRALAPGQAMPADAYVSTAASDRRSLDDARSALQATCDAASAVRGENAESVRRCRAEIDRAKAMRFARPPGFWGRLKDSVCGWVADHADVLLKISSVLKTISAVAGLLSMIPVLAPVMGPIALATGGAALAIDVGVKLATGKGSWTGIVVDAATMLLPGVGKVLGKAARAAVPGALRAAETTGGRVVNVMRNSAAGKFVDAVTHSRAGRAVMNAPGRVVNKMDVAVANKIRNMPRGRSYLDWAENHGWSPSIRQPHDGVTVYRVYGRPQDAAGHDITTGMPDGSVRTWGSNPAGRSWTPEDPRLTDNFRRDAGLPNENPGRFIVTGTLVDRSAVTTVRPALELDGQPGGWPEYLIGDAGQSVHVVSLQGVNEPWTMHPGDWAPPSP